MNRLPNPLPFLLVICSFSNFLNAQNKVSVSGLFEDENNIPIYYLEVLITSDKAFTTVDVTDKDGRFKFDLSPGTYTLLANYFGQNVYERKIALFKSTDLGVIKIDKSFQLEGVTVTAEKKLIEKKVDRLVFNVENSTAASGGDALDALKITPRIRVQNNKISMIGKSGMGVLIDNKLIQLSGDDLTNFLRTIKTEDIKSIEVITNPPAKYQAEGNSGLINIKLKKGKNNSWNTSLRSSYKQATYPTGDIGASFSYRKNTLSLFSDINYSRGSIAPTTRSKIFYPKQLWNERGDRQDFKNLLSYRLGVNYDISNKISMGVQYMGNYSKPNINELNRLTLIDNITQAIDSTIVTRSRANREKKYNSINANFTYKIDSMGRVLSLDLDFFSYRSGNVRNITSNNFLGDGSLIANSFFAAQNTSDQDITNYSLNLDMEHPLKQINLNYGGRLSFSRTNNAIVFKDLSSGTPVVNPSQSDTYKYRENTQALYFSVHKKFSDRIEAKAGIRMENTKIEGRSLTLNQTNENAYTKFFPTAYLSFFINEKNNISLNYGRRISRPAFSWFNPFRWFYSNFSFAEGNPNLTPSFTHNIELDYTHNDNWINSFYFSSLENGFEYVTIVDEKTNTQKLFAKNFITTNVVGLYEMLSLELLKGVSSTIAIDVYYSDSRSSIPVTNQSRSGWNLEGSVGSDFVLQKDKKILLNLSYRFTSDGVDNLDRNTAFSQLDVALKFFLLDKNLQITLTGNDVLKTSLPEYSGFSNTFRTTFKNYYDARFFRISLVYNLGKKIDIKERKMRNAEERDRI